MSENEFELFDTRIHRVVKNPYISIRRWGLISFNKKTLDSFFSKGEKYLQLYFNRKKNIIGIKPLSEPRENVLKVNWNNRKNYATCAGKLFFSHYDIDFSKTRVFPATWDKKLEMILIDLNRPIFEDKKT